MFSKQRGRGRGAFNLNLQGHGDFKMNQQGRNHGKENNIFGQQGPINENIPSKVTAAERAKRFGSTSKSAIYDKFKKNRVTERQQAVKNGFIPDPNAPTRLEDAIDFRGTCQEKCPEFEMIEREIQNGLDPLEVDEQGNVDPEKAVKAYRRSAAGNEQPLPSDVRSPEALITTLDYLIDHVLSTNALEKCHAFVRDRTRSIRQDFTLQNIRDVTAVQVHERIARFHILCLHEMCEFDESKFSEQQETEQLRKVLLSLIEFYDDLREEGIETENEAEFRAYYMISHIRDQDVARQAQTLPITIFRHPYMKRALEFHALTQRNNEIMETSSRRNKPLNIEASQNFYSAFFRLIADPNTTFLMACMLECHFADIRKGALKAMNVSYMLKAGGVEAEYVRQVLAYDSLQHLLQEANLYGIIIDMSLGEPTLCFGQKHYRVKVPIFIEPLSNPSQKKSLLLIEPKKAGRTFRDIINGENMHLTNANIQVYTRQPTNCYNAPKQSVFSKLKNVKARNPPVLNFKLAELTGEESVNINQQQQREEEEKKHAVAEQQQKLDQVRAQAAAAAMAAAAERKKMEDLIAKKKMEEARLEEEKRLEAQRLMKEKERIARELDEERKRKTDAARKEQLLCEERAKQMADMRRNVIKSQLCNGWINQLLEEVIMEKVQQSARKVINTRSFIKRTSKPIVQRARQRIEKRNIKALGRRQFWNMSMCIINKNPYSSWGNLEKSRPLHSTPEGIRDRVQQCILAEKYALEDLKKPLEDHQLSIWKTENFSECIYPRIRDKIVEFEHKHIVDKKLNWQLLVNVPDTKVDSSVWFKRKFGFDDCFDRRVDRYQAFNITLRMITPESALPSQWVDETSAVIFSLPESNQDKTPQETAEYWIENRNRLDKMISDLQKYNPGIRVPVVFTYFPDPSCTESTLQKLPIYLGLDSNKVINDYHILLMNPLTIPDRIVDEVNWLSSNSILNHQSGSVVK